MVRRGKIPSHGEVRNRYLKHLKHRAINVRIKKKKITHLIQKKKLAKFTRVIQISNRSPHYFSQKTDFVILFLKEKNYTELITKHKILYYKRNNHNLSKKTKFFYYVTNFSNNKNKLIQILHNFVFLLLTVRPRDRQTTEATTQPPTLLSSAGSYRLSSETVSSFQRHQSSSFHYTILLHPL